MQRVPDLNLVEHDGDRVCDDCGEEGKFLVGGDNKFRCKTCFTGDKPEYLEAIADFAELLDLMLEIKSQLMTQEEMHELYGNTEE